MPRRRKRKSSFNPTLSRGLIAIVLVIFAAIVTLSFFDKAGAVGIMLDKYVMSFLFGSIRYTAPVVILILAWFLIKDIEYDYHPTHGIGAFLFFLAMSSLMHIGFDPVEMWTQSLEGVGGGVFGMFAWPLKTYLGSTAGIVILVGLVAASILFMFNTSITYFVMLNKRILSGMGLLGKAILNLFKVFLKSGSRKNVRIEGDYEDYDDDDEEEEDEDYDDEEEDEPKRKFSAKIVGDDDDDYDDDEGEEEDDDDEEKGESKGPWSKRVVIKDLPPLSILTTKRGKPTSGDIKANAQTIHDTLSDFNIDVDMGEVQVGPTVTQYTLKPPRGVKLSRITALSNNLSLNLAAHPIRMEAPIPGKSLVGIEVPNKKTALVSLQELLGNKVFKKREHNLMIALGKDVAGKVWFGDLPRMPHLLIAGATGSGKTVCVNTIIMSLLYQNTAETLRFIMVDPKRVELTPYNGIPHLLTPVITNTQKTVNALKWTIGEMERRFELFSKTHSRDIASYNAKHPNDKIPHIIFIIDELADLMATAANEMEAGIIRIAQMARAVGIHLIVATQRPSVDVITGLMKANIPARISFSVASQIDSRTILDCPGAEKLLGRGDMLYLTADISKPKRIQGAFISESELKGLVRYLKSDETPEYDESIVGKQTGKGGTVNMFGGVDDDQDPLFGEAKEEIMRAGKASASFLQRRLKIGYARAARILDELESAGIIGPSQGAKPREILITEKETMDMGGELNVFEDDNSEEEVDEDEYEYDDSEEEESMDEEEYSEEDEDDNE